MSTAIDVSLVLHIGTYDTGKMQYIEHIRSCLEASCHFSGDDFSYIESAIETDTKLHSLGKNRLLMIITSSIDVEEYKKLAWRFAGNDIVFLMLYHPFEIEPRENSIFESQLPNKRYYTEMNNRIVSIQKYLHSSWISNIVLRTTDNIVLKLNHFFKHRYG